jgi:hypothetical protein
MAKVYIVSEGEYSDYHINGVYSTKEKAEFAHKLFGIGEDWDGKPVEIEEWELDALPNHPPGMFWYEVRMNENGNVEKVHTADATDANEKWTDEWRPYGDKRSVLFSQWAKDETHAIKIANEKRVQLIASGEWTTNHDEWWAKRYGPNRQ